MEQKTLVVGSPPRAAFDNAVTSPHLEIYVWDGHNHNARRRQLFEGYKVRPPTAEDIFTGLNLIRELLIYTKAVQVEVPEWEADDVIGTLAKHYSSLGHEVTVHSNDLDYYQLLQHPRIYLNGVSNPHNIPTKYLPLFKTLVGDSSDRIPGIPGFGVKSFFELEPYWDKIIEYITTNGWYDDIPFKPKIASWIVSNQDLIYTYWRIVHLWDVDLELISEHTYPGVNNPAEGEKLLRRFML